MAEWPDWSGQVVVIVATGPSAAASEVLPRGRHRPRIIAIRSSWRLAPWADVLYGCDRAWWFENDGVPEFRRLKVSASPLVGRHYPDVKIVSLVKGARIVTGETGRIGCGSRLGGGHSGFQAINLAVQFGARRILLVGFDMDQPRMKDWREEMDGAAPQFVDLGVEVINCSPVSALKAYPKMSLSEAMG